MSQPIVISGLSDIPRPTTPATDGFLQLPFETRADLGKKGTRNMDRLTAMAIGGMAGLMPALNVDRETPKDEIGIVLGSAQGSMDSIVRFTHETLCYDRPDFVNPALFPNTVMNCAAGQAAIWYQLRGLNTTISCQEMSFLSALEYSCLQLRRKAAKTLITGSVEELTEVNRAGYRAMSRDRKVAPKFTEYSLFVTLESEEEARTNNRQTIATIRSVATGFNGDAESAQPLANLIRNVLSNAETAPETIAAAVISGTWPAQRDAETDAVRDVLGEAPQLLVTFDHYGNAGSSHNALQLSQLLETLSPGEIGLLVAQERAGNMAALVIEKGPLT